MLNIPTVCVSKPWAFSPKTTRLPCSPGPRRATELTTEQPTPETLLDAIRRAAAGDSPFSQHVLRRLIRCAAERHETPPPSTPPDDLTDRERDVLALVADGLSNAEIAARLHVSVTTVKTHVANLMTKTGADNRVRLAMVALGSPRPGPDVV